jgi:hypothetical protein
MGVSFASPRVKLEDRNVGADAIPKQLCFIPVNKPYAAAA